jgi:hypothetical protein
LRAERREGLFIMRGSRSTQASSPSDLLCAVTERPKDLVALRGWRTAKKGLAKKGFTYSQTISPSLVTSKKRPKEDSVINVLPFGSRCAQPMRGEKKFQAGLS